MDEKPGRAALDAEHRQAEERLQESEEQYRRMVETTNEGVWLVDAQARTAYVNRRMADMLGYTVEEMQGKPLQDFLFEEDRPLLEGKMQRRREGIGEQYDLRYRRKNGTSLWTIVSTTPILDRNGQFSGALAMHTDVTARKQAEDRLQILNAELEQRVQERTTELETSKKDLESFAYAVAHDLLTPLRSIDAFYDRLVEDHAHQLDREGVACLDRIHAAIQHMQELIQDLLTLSGVTATTLCLENVDLTRMAQAIAEEMKSCHPGRNIEFKIEEGLTARGDQRLLRVALANLMANACKFTGRRPQPVIEFGQVLKDDRQVIFIRDNGVGFDMNAASRLFEPFQRLHSPGEYEGTGIGLATVKRIIRRHHGQIWAEGVVDGGAVFYFILGEP